MARSNLYPPSVKPGIPQEFPAPAGWSWVKFGDLLHEVERPIALLDEAEYQLVTAKRSRGGIVERERLIGKDVLTKSQFTIESGDFLISKRQVIHGACGVVPPELDGSIVSNEYAALHTSEVLLPAYLTAYSHTVHFQQTTFQSSVGVDVEKMIFRLDEWFKHRMLVPPIAEQRKISDILTSVDNAIHATQKVIDQTSVVKQGLLQELMTRGIGHTKFKITEIGEIPDAWRVGQVGELADFSNGHGFTPPVWSDKGLPIIRIQNLNGSREFNYFEGVPEEKWIVETGDLLFAWAGVLGVSFGPRIWKGPKGVLNQHIFKLVPRGDFDKIWLSGVLWLVTKRIEGKAHGFKASLLHVRKGEITGQLVPIPPTKEQGIIAKCMTDLDVIDQFQTAHFESLKALKQGLLQNLLSGKVRVSVN